MKPFQGLVLVVGATGSIGRLVVAEALAAGHQVRALVRDRQRASDLLPAGVDLFEADLTRADLPAAIVQGVEAIVFTHGSYGMRGRHGRAVDYGGVLNVLRLLAGRRPRIVLMTAIGVTKREDAVQGKLETHDWKRRAERLVRASGCPYSIVRPGWFDYHQPGQQRLLLLQGDTRWASNPSDGAISRAQLAHLLVHCLSSDAASNCSFELVAGFGPAPQDLDSLLRPLVPDSPGRIDAQLDIDNMPFDEEPPDVRKDLLAFNPLANQSGRNAACVDESSSRLST